MTNPALRERLLQVAVESVSGESATPLLRVGDWWVAHLPHHDSRADLVRIGGPFFLGKEKEEAIRDVLDILVGVLAASRPFCSIGEFDLEIEGPDRVRWAFGEEGDREKDKVRGGPEPLDQALVHMSYLGIDEEPFENMLAIAPSLEALPGWGVKFLRSCCLTLAQQRGDLTIEIGVFLTPKHTVSLCTKSVEPNSKPKLGACAATYLGHILPFVREATERVDELLEFQFPPDTEAVVMRWGRKPVSISPHGHQPWQFLPSI
jgi:hypothetical protein